MEGTLQFSLMMTTYKNFWHKNISSIIKLTINANNQSDGKYNQETTPLLYTKENKYKWRKASNILILCHIDK